MKKSVTIHFRLTQAEKTALQHIARQDLRNPSAMIRELIRKEAQARGLWPLILARVQNSHKDS